MAEGDCTRAQGGLRGALAVRFVLWTLAVLAAESVVALLERYALAPLLALVVRRELELRTSQNVIAWAASVVWRQLVLGESGGVGLLAGSAALGLLAFMVMLVVAPVVLCALGFARQAERLVAAELHARDNELRQAYERRNLMVSDMAHDLRTPIMALSGLAQALDEGLVEDEPTRRRYLSSIRAKADRLAQLVTTLFDFVRLESEGYRLDLAPIDLPQLLLAEAAQAYSDVEEAGMTLSVHVPEEPLQVRADAPQLSRAVSNLLVNAMRHNEPGTTVELAMSRRAGVADIIVADSGQPIEGDPQELFAPFARGDAARTGEGSGLGLSIVADIVALHGWTIEVRRPYGPYAKAFVITCGIDDE